ncbi:MAG: protein translocase subunit SecF [Gammaproteobacteria bacterium]|nr:protein translocase subunit SecF [Gammaproteobacteria bacterium]MCF6364388.1 protein translocase subunit SecF [Gammaproteobacteria bacterium]
MQLFKNATKFDFMGRRKPAIALSVVLLLISIGALVGKGLNFGLDFTGGTLIELGYSHAVDLKPVRETLESLGFAEAVVQHFGTASDILIRIAPDVDTSNAEISNIVMDALKASEPGEIQMRRVEFVGPQVGEELTNDGGLAMIYALICILVYVGFRFEYRLAVGSVMALVHDVVITLGVFALFQLDFDLTVLAAVLAVIGYSLNDTIVVFDRIRENFRKMRKGTSEEVINVSLNQTLTRTVMTSFTTLLVLIALFIFGGELIHGFATALIIGVVVGTYSSIYVASSSALMLGISKADLMPVVVEKEGEEIDDRP